MSKTTRNWLRPLTVVALAFIVYGFIAHQVLRGRSVAPYFVSLADSFLHGHADVVPPLDNGAYDLIYYQDRWYVAQPPLPALLLMPLVALRGADSVSDVAFNVFLPGNRHPVAECAGNRLVHGTGCSQYLYLGLHLDGGSAATFARRIDAWIGDFWATIYLTRSAGLCDWLLVVDLSGTPTITAENRDVIRRPCHRCDGDSGCI